MHTSWNRTRCVCSRAQVTAASKKCPLGGANGASDCTRARKTRTRRPNLAVGLFASAKRECSKSLRDVGVLTFHLFIYLPAFICATRLSPSIERSGAISALPADGTLASTKSQLPLYFLSAFPTNSSGDAPERSGAAGPDQRFPGAPRCSLTFHGEERGRVFN